MIEEQGRADNSRETTIPLHVGIIPDGNRRWARRHGENLLKTYMRGYKNVVNIVKHLYDRGVKAVTVYGLSYDNCIKRDPLEKKIIEQVALYALRDMRDSEMLRTRKVRVLFLGDSSIFSETLEVEVGKTSKALDYNGDRLLVVLLCYSGRWEIDTYLSKGMVPPSLLLPPIDLIIRTGGARRLSGFVPISSEYAELYFTEKLWPDFTVKDADEALKWFSKQERNFGR
jgi:undecaprenyl pyrophosphate synthase